MSNQDARKIYQEIVRDSQPNNSESKNRLWYLLLAVLPVLMFSCGLVGHLAK